MTPRVSICIPTYNRAADLRRALAGMLAQTVQDFEILVGDDASSDDTPDVVRSVPDDRIRYLRHPQNLGIYGNWNALIRAARGEFVCIYHDHDTYLPTIVERSLDVFGRHPDAAFVHTAFVLVDRDGVPMDVFAGEFEETTPGDELRRRIARTTRNTISAATAMVRRELYERVGAFDAGYGLPADREMWFRLAARGTVGHVPEPQALIVGRSRGDPTERFAVADFAGNHRISVEALAALHSATRRARWESGARLWAEQQGDIAAAVLKAMAFESGDASLERARLLRRFAMPGLGTTLVLLSRSPVRRILGRAARAWYEASQSERRRRAIRFCAARPELSAYVRLPPDNRSGS